MANHGVDFYLFTSKSELICRQSVFPIYDCGYLRRLLEACKYYHSLKQLDNVHMQSKFVKFCLDVYKELLNDIHHLQSYHSTELNLIKAQLISNQILSECDATKCLYSQRHYSDRIARNDIPHMENDTDEQYAFYEQVMDGLHFNIFHLYEIGLRYDVNTEEIKYNKNENDEEKLDSARKDFIFAQMTDNIYMKCKQYYNMYNRFTRTNNKFTINMSYNIRRQHTNSQDKSALVWGKAREIMNKYFSGVFFEKTCTDIMLKYMETNHIKRNEINTMATILSEEEYDTDAIMYDNTANVHNLTMSAQSTAILQKFIHHYQETKHHFSTGITFWYWKHYNPLKFKEGQNSTEYIQSQFNINDYGGYKVSELFIAAPKFATLKDEVINSGFCSMQQFMQLIVLKSNKYIKTMKSKLCTADVDGVIQFSKNLVYGIKRGSKISLKHLQSVICYCDLTDLCTDFSSTFRATRFGESLKCIKLRNKNYYHLSKALRESVEYFGNKGKVLNTKSHNLKDLGFYVHDKMIWMEHVPRAEKGPFYCGISNVMNVPAFNIRLCGPTSTSKYKEIAIRFATRNGMIMQLNNTGDWYGRNLHFFDCSWISTYSEEEERLFFGGAIRIRVESVTIIETKQNFRDFFRAMFYFDAMINSSAMDENEEPCEKDYTILRDLILNELGYTTNEHLDKYISDTFHLFCQTQETICLNLHYMHMYFMEMSNLIMYSINSNETFEINNEDEKKRIKDDSDADDDINYRIGFEAILKSNVKQAKKRSKIKDILSQDLPNDDKIYAIKRILKERYNEKDIEIDPQAVDAMVEKVRGKVRDEKYRNLFRPLVFLLFPKIKNITIFTTFGKRTYSFAFKKFRQKYLIDAFRSDTKIVIKAEGLNNWIVEKKQVIPNELAGFNTKFTVTKGFGSHTSAANHHKNFMHQRETQFSTVIVTC
eukprot:954_1